MECYAVLKLGSLCNHEWVARDVLAIQILVIVIDLNVLKT